MAIQMPIPTFVGQQYQASNDVTYVWDGQKWISIGVLVAEETPTVSVGANSPENPKDGDLWFNIVNGIMYVYYESETIWVDVRPPGEEDAGSLPDTDP